jgi:nitroreductase
MIKELITKNRSYRRFYQDVPIQREILKELVDLARLSASGSNLQPLKYILTCEPEVNEMVFRHLGWAGYIKDWSGPAEGEKPSAYIIILGDKEIRKSFGVDPGIAAQSILLGATDRGFGGCIFGSAKKEPLRKDFKIPDQFDVLLVIALGKPKEVVQIDDLAPDGDIKYWRDDNKVHHVPKRLLEDIILDL